MNSSPSIPVKPARYSRATSSLRYPLAKSTALGVDPYVAGLVHLPEELEIQEERAARIARACNAYVGFASFVGTTGGGFTRTAGVSSIWSQDGLAIARGG
jgi:hypothetical protein